MLVGEPMTLRTDPGQQQRNVKGFAFVYVGKGHVPGIPARNLTQAEADKFGWALIRGIQCCHTGQRMYREVE